MNISELKDGEHIVIQVEPHIDHPIWLSFCKSLVRLEEADQMTLETMQRKLDELRGYLDMFHIEVNR